MKLCVVLEYRFSQTPDGAVWKETPFPHDFWDHYLRVFDGVRVVARLRQVPQPPPSAQRADVDRVEFASIPYFLGPRQYLIRAVAVRRAARRAIGPTDAVLFCAPSHLASVLVPFLNRRRRPYAVTVVGDPYDVFAPGTVDHPLRPFFRWHYTRNLRRQCRQACAVMYVTRHALQRRYPPAAGAFATWCSDVQLREFGAESPRPVRRKTSWRLVAVGSLAQRYKGIDTLVEALALCRSQGLDVELAIVGDGKYRGELQQQVAALGLGSRVHFRGQLPAGEAVGAELSRSDLFVMPSRTEGLPRAMIEAMASALPCIGTSVGGIPELLSPEALVPPNDPQALASKIHEVLADPDRMGRMSEENLQRSREFQEEVVVSRKTAYYEHLRAATAVWLEQGSQLERRPILALPGRRWRKRVPLRHPTEAH